jgi:hypothetical protein
MKCFKGWTIGLAATALLAAPGAILAQQPPPSTPPSPSRPAGAEGQSAALEHLTKAKTALADIPETSLTGSARTQVSVLKRRISALEQTASKEPTPTQASWASDVAAIDRTLTELLDGPGAPTASQPAGTAGRAAPSAANKPAEAGLDETARTKLQEVRSHVTAFAAAMSGGAASPSVPPSAAAAPPANPTPAAAAPTAPPAAAPTPTEPSPAQQPAQPPAASPTTPQSDPAAPAKPEAAQSQVDTEQVKRHLTAARESLSQLTQLPAAAQLTGDARTQVSQLITNFNELITTNTEWRASYAKVQTNLNALIGDQRTDESPAAPTTPATPAAGAPGAVGTSGTVAIDPAIKAKLVEFRTHLLEFEKAAGGAGAAPPAAAREPEPSAAASSPPTPAGPAASETAAAASPAAAAAPAAPAAASSVAGAAGTAGSTAEAPQPAGTSGRTPAAEPEPQSRSGATPDQSSPRAASKQSGHADAMRHIEAIEAILNGRASEAKADTPAGTSGRATSPTSLDRAQIEQIKQHLTELRRALAQSDGR